MQIPLEITFRDMPHWDAVDEEIRAKATDLEQFYDRITRCRVVVSAPHVRSETGQRYSVHIDIGVPGRAIIVDRDVPHEKRQDDIYVAIRDAFRRAQRQLQDYVRERRDQVKHHVS